MDHTMNYLRVCTADSIAVGYLEKLEFSFEIKACEKFYRRYIQDIGVSAYLRG